MSQLTVASRDFLSQASLIQIRLQGQGADPISRQELAELELRIDDFVREKLTGLQPSKELEQELEGVKERIAQSKALISDLKGIPLDFGAMPIKRGDANFIQPLLPPALSGAFPFNKVPVLGRYDLQGYHMGQEVSFIRLSPAQRIPASVMALIGDRDGKKVDYFQVVEDTSAITRWIREHRKQVKDLPSDLNLVTHYWVHPHYEYGKESKCFVEMGICDELNVYPILSDIGIPFRAMKPLEVICHPSEGSTALSPYNAIVGVSSNKPFSSFWSVLKHGNRTVATRHVLLHERDSFDGQIKDVFLKGGSMSEINTRLREVNETQKQSLLKLAASLEKNDSYARQLFDALPDYQKYSIYYQTWVEKWKEKHADRPAPHGDFGKASFHCYGDLKSEFHCSSADQGSIVRNYASVLYSELDKLVQDTELLFAPLFDVQPRSPEQIEKIRLLQPVADAFERGDEKEGMALFTALDKVHRHGVYEYVWEAKGCPRTFPGDFGEASFFAKDARLEDYERCGSRDRVKAILAYIYSI